MLGSVQKLSNPALLLSVKLQKLIQRTLIYIWIGLLCVCDSIQQLRFTYTFE